MQIYNGKSNIPYGNMVDGLQWEYKEWKTVYYEA